MARPAFDIDTSSFDEFASNISRVLDKNLKKELKAGLKTAAGYAVRATRAGYAERSTKAAASVRAGTAIQRSGVRAIIRAGGKAAPITQLLELGNLDHSRVLHMGSVKIKATFRHPVFPKGDDRKKWTWSDTNSRTRPSLYPAVLHQREFVTRSMHDAVVKSWMSLQPRGVR